MTVIKSQVPKTRRISTLKMNEQNAEKHNYAESVLSALHRRAPRNILCRKQMKVKSKKLSQYWKT